MEDAAVVVLWKNSNVLKIVLNRMKLLLIETLILLDHKNECVSRQSKIFHYC